MAVTKNQLMTYEVYMQYILKLLCGYLYHPTSCVPTLRQRRNMCATFQLIRNQVSESPREIIIRKTF